MSVQSIYNKTINEARERCTYYLYDNTTKNSPPKIWEIKNTENPTCRKNEHEFWRLDETYGHAVFVFRICTICGNGDVECNPPLNFKKKVIS